MTDHDKTASQVIQNSRDISTLQEKLNAIDKRVDESANVIKSIHEISADVKTLTLQVKHLAENVSSTITRLEASIRGQGERIGGLERSVFAVERLEKSINSLTAKVEALEQEPAAKWKLIAAQITAIIITAVITGIAVSLGYGGNLL